MAKLFWSRLVLYALTVSVPLYYPGVVIAYDRVGFLTWFGYLPIMLLLGGFLRPPRRALRVSLLVALAVALVFSLYAGWDRDGLALTGAGLLAWVLTLLIFLGGYRGVAFAAIEMFLLAGVYYRLLTFSRASEDVARATAGWLVPLTVLAVAAFLLHGLVLYMAAFPERSIKHRRRELIIFGAAGFPLLLLLLVFLPTDFVRNDMVLNRFFEEPQQQEIPPSDSQGDDDRGGPSQGEDDANKNGLPLGGRKSTEPRRSDGSSMDPGGDSDVREIRPDEHRTSKGPGRGEHGAPESGGRPREGNTAKNDPNGGKDNRPQKSEPSGNGGQSGKQESPDTGKSGKKQSEKTDSGKKESGKESPGGGDSPTAGKSAGKGEEPGAGNQSAAKNESKKESEDPKGGKQPDKSEKDAGKGESPKSEEGKSGERNKPAPDGPRGRRENRLRGTPAENYKPQWSDRAQSGDGDGGHQFALMVVASAVEPVYSAEAYWNDLDPETGFRVAKEDFYNQIGRSRLLETWRNPNTIPDDKRRPVEIIYYSAVPDRVVPYFPEMMEPTKLSVRYRPFDLSYRARALMSASGPEDWKTARDLSITEQRDLARFLKVKISPAHRSAFRSRVRTALRGKTTYYEKMDAIMRSLSGYQYELGFDEDTSLAKLSSFLTKTKTGDCTEFSHSIAIMARMAGIPARVVTGYVAAKDLQTAAHRRGLVELRKRIAPLKEIPLKNLYLVTSAHRHAWAQFYVPGYGWIDMETTSHAKPPKPSMDPNQRDVVIPLIEPDKVASPIPEGRRKINWRVVAIVSGLVLLAFLFLLYSYRYLRELVWFMRSRGSGPAATEALYRLTLSRLAARGYPLKEPFETPLEYARRVPETLSVAEQFNQLRFRETLATDQRKELARELRGSYRGLWKQVRSGSLGWLGRIFSLRALYY